MPFEVPYFEGVKFKYHDPVIAFAFISGIHYNLENIIIGFYNAEGIWTKKGKVFALCALVPYA